MKTLLLIFRVCFLVFLLPASAICQNAWQRVEDFDNIDKAHWIECVNNFIYTLHESQGSLGPVRQILTQWSDGGKINWRKQFVFAGQVWNGQGLVLNDGGIIVDLIYQDTAIYEHRIHQIDADGDIKWITILPGFIEHLYPLASRYYDIELSEDGNFLFYNIMFTYRSQDPFSVRNGLLTLSSEGEEIDYTFYDTGDTIKWPFWVAQSPDGSSIRTYRPKKPHIDQTFAVEKIDIQGDPVWTYDLGVEEGGGSKGPVCTDDHGNVYFTWKKDTSGLGGFWGAYPTIHSLSPNGVLRWWKYYGTSDDYQFLGDILFSSQKTIVTCGSETNGFLSGKNNTGWLICADTLGNTIWERRYVLEETRTFGNWFWELTQTADGGFAMLGEMFPADNSSFQNLWIIKTDSMGCLIPGCGLYNYISILTEVDEEISHPALKILLHCSEEELHLFPMSDDNLSSSDYIIMGLNGQALARGSIVQEEAIDVHSLVQGLYVFTLIDQNGQIKGSAKFWKP